MGNGNAPQRFQINGTNIGGGGASGGCIDDIDDKGLDKYVYILSHYECLLMLNSCSRFLFLDSFPLPSPVSLLGVIIIF